MNWLLSGSIAHSARPQKQQKYHFIRAPDWMFNGGYEFEPIKFQTIILIIGWCQQLFLQWSVLKLGNLRRCKQL